MVQKRTFSITVKPAKSQPKEKKCFLYCKTRIIENIQYEKTIQNLKCSICHHHQDKKKLRFIDREQEYVQCKLDMKSMPFSKYLTTRVKFPTAICVF